MRAWRDSRAAGVPVRLVAAAKDESDTELAVRLASSRVRIGSSSSAALAARAWTTPWPTSGSWPIPALREIPTILLHPQARVSLISAPGRDRRSVRLELPGPVDGLVSLLPQGDGVVGVTTGGLAYPLADEPLPAGPARGLSNVRVAHDAWVEVRAGRLLVVEGPATLSA